jgi:hypothetical protein
VVPKWFWSVAKVGQGDRKGVSKMQIENIYLSSSTRQGTLIFGL